jgi:transcriptional regulator with XRE-family HTH domain
MNEEIQKPSVTFGDFVRSTRMKNGLTGRDASSAAGMLPSNFSKLEHGVLLPPQDPEKLRRLAEAIKIEPGSDTESLFFDLASKSNGSVPLDLADIISRNETVPLLLRTIGNKRLSAKDIERLVEIVHMKE